MKHYCTSCGGEWTSEWTGSHTCPSPVTGAGIWGAIVDEVGLLRAEVERLRSHRNLLIREAGTDDICVLADLRKNLDAALLRLQEVQKIYEWAKCHWDKDAPLLAKMEAALDDSEDQRSPRMTTCVHCEIEVPGNVPCPKCGRKGGP